MNIQLAYQWLLNNQSLINQSIKFGPEQLQTFFNVYNTITGENKSKTTCGRCIINIKHRLKTETIKINNMKTFNVYRTQAGNLTLKKPKDNTIVFQIHATTDTGAKEALQQLKAIEKKDNKKIDENNNEWI